MSFLEMSLMGGAMILCILLLRMFSRGRLPAAVLSAMWAAALIRLLVPVEIPSALSIAGLIKQAWQPAAMTLPLRYVPNMEPLSPLVFIWLCGAVFCACFFLVAGARQRRVLKMALPAPMTPELLASLAAQHLPRKVAVYTSDRISTPLTYGMIRPRIVLPSTMALGGQELGFVMAHEGGHILRRDAAKKCVLLFAVCLHWFNPLVWLMADMCRRDMELHCDNRVLKAYGPQMRAAYARTLLDLEERKRFSGVLAECLSVSPLEKRIRSIMAGKKTTLPGTLAAIAAYGCAAAMLFTSPGVQPTVTVSTVWISSTPLAAFETLQESTQAASVYVMSDGEAGGRPVFKPSSIYITRSGWFSQATPVETSSSVSVKYGGTMAAAAGEAVVSSAWLPVYSTTYTSKSSAVQP